MIQHLWLLDALNRKYVCFPHGKFGEVYCHGCGIELTETLLQRVPYHSIPDHLLEGRREGGPQLLAALDWIEFKQARNELPLLGGD